MPGEVSLAFAALFSFRAKSGFKHWNPYMHNRMIKVKPVSCTLHYDLVHNQWMKRARKRRTVVELRPDMPLEDRVKYARINAGYTVAQAARTFGIAESTWGNYESGHRGILAFKEHAGKAAGLFKVSYVWLVLGKGVPHEPGGPHPAADIYDKIPQQYKPGALDLLRAYSRAVGGPSDNQEDAP